MSDDSELIRKLNDAHRNRGPVANTKWLITQGVIGEGEEFVAEAIQKVTEYDDFSPDNDPYGEHDFGSFNIGSQLVFWKIDYYDPTMEFGSENPADESVTCRVLTIMLSSEY